ncbi:hypothetical protein [Halorussus sp. MSC15.2]|uniref:hypothetical protein n=1 Tax=Halorussus sp. MSC15.2 TaxID=2283638 RepID=UPI0013D81D72|nr:hypothetical protein [Halorussus sp. MSC15.2]NEU57079.1 hypothetical protein [Halorussus sp. MSC15.2]
MQRYGASGAHHATEIDRTDRLSGPMLALALDGTLSLAVTYGEDVWVEDSDRGGAAFVVELPRHDDV